MTKSDCIQCGGTAQYRFRALEIHTLHIREFKEKRVQALGESVHFDVCADCARAQLQKDLSGVGIKDILPFALILLFGIVLSAVFWNGEGVFRLCGAAGVICGILGIASTARENRQRRDHRYACRGHEGCAGLCRSGREPRAGYQNAGQRKNRGLR